MRAAQKVRSWTVQNEMRGVLGQVVAGAGGRILNSANPREIKLNNRLCRLQRGRERTQQACSFEHSNRAARTKGESDRKKRKVAGL